MDNKKFKFVKGILNNILLSVSKEEEASIKKVNEEVTETQEEVVLAEDEKPEDTNLEEEVKSEEVPVEEEVESEEQTEELIEEDIVPPVDITVEDLAAVLGVDITEGMHNISFEVVDGVISWGTISSEDAQAQLEAVNEEMSKLSNEKAELETKLSEMKKEIKMKENVITSLSAVGTRSGLVQAPVNNIGANDLSAAQKIRKYINK